MFKWKGKPPEKAVANPEYERQTMLTVEQCRQIAARIWCDFEFKHVVMDVEACERIAQELFRVQAK